MTKQVTLKFKHPSFGDQMVVLGTDGTVAIEVPEAEPILLRVMEIEAK